MVNIVELSLIPLAYLLGSISGALICCTTLRLPDPRSQGSGNPGATNVLRYGGKTAALCTLLIDVLKGVLAVGLAKLSVPEISTIAMATLAVFLGHLYPIFLRFRGGKGVATAFGALLMLNWALGLTALATWLTIALLFRYSSLAALITALLTPIYTHLFLATEEYTIASFLISTLLIWRHRSNIHHLLTGQEQKISPPNSSHSP